MKGKNQILSIEGLTKQFGAVVAVDDITVTFNEDELCAIIGPNGAGKTTFINLLSGTLKPSTGKIYFKNNDVTDLSAHEMAKNGLIRSFQITEIFNELSVLENVRISLQQQQNPYDFWKHYKSGNDLTEDAYNILEMLGLEEKAQNSAVELSHGEQRTLELGIVLGTDPDILLLDEPTSGMSPEETEDVVNIIGNISSNYPILLVEHKMSVVRRVADRIMVLHNGGKIADGTPSKVKNDEQVRQVYLGGEEL